MEQLLRGGWTGLERDALLGAGVYCLPVVGVCAGPFLLADLLHTDLVPCSTVIGGFRGGWTHSSPAARCNP